MAKWMADDDVFFGVLRLGFGAGKVSSHESRRQRRSATLACHPRQPAFSKHAA
jgi:hypothetical protein